MAHWKDGVNRVSHEGVVLPPTYWGPDDDEPIFETLVTELGALRRPPA